LGLLVALPHLPDGARRAQVRWLDIIDGTSTAVQRNLRRGGVSGFEPSTMATLLTLFADRPAGFTFFDVGANIGLYGSTCAMLFEPGHVVAFEPTPSTAAVARRIAAANGLDTRVEELALGDEEGEAQLFLSAKSDASNSLVEGFKEAVGTVTVGVTTMDRYVAQSGLVPDVIKIDAETFEPQILAGAVRTIESSRPAIVVEALRRGGVDHGKPLNKIMKRLHYTFYRIDAQPSWEARPSIRAARRSGEGPVHRDWLLVPDPLDAQFENRYRAWFSAVALCTKDRNKV